MPFCCVCSARSARHLHYAMHPRVLTRSPLTTIVQFAHRVEEAAEDAEKKRTFKFPFIACEVFTCEVDAILTTLVEDEELMSKLFSFLEPDHSHGNSLAGYFCKAHQEIVKKLVDLIGITSVMEFVSINEFLRPAAGEVYYGGCGRGRGRGSRVGYHGNSNNAQTPSIEDSGHFPTLGGN